MEAVGLRGLRDSSSIDRLIQSSVSVMRLSLLASTTAERVRSLLRSESGGKPCRIFAFPLLYYLLYFSALSASSNSLCYQAYTVAASFGVLALARLQRQAYPILSVIENASRVRVGLAARTTL